MSGVATELRRREFPVELRVAGGEDERPRIEGHAAVFNALSEPMWGMREKIDPGAFAESIETDDVRALWNHDPNYVLGRNTANTLTLTEDERGLAVVIDPPETQWAKDLLVSMRRGDVNQMSFGFHVLDEAWEKKDGENIRTLKKVSLFDVSVVTYPAYPQTDVQVRDIFRAAGIDWDGVAGVLFRSQRGLTLTDSDRDMVMVAIDVLRSSVPELSAQGSDGEEPDDRSNGDEPEQGLSLVALRRRLELASRAV